MSAPSSTNHSSATLAFWRRIFDGERGFINLFSGARDGKKLTDVRQRFYPYPAAITNAQQWLADEADAGREVYAGAALYTDRRRHKSAVGQVRAVWVDGDGATIPPDLPRPTLTVATSPGRWNYYWLLTQPVDGATAEDLNRRIAYAIDADHGGWDSTQLLRVPGTPNYKYADAPTVTIIADDGPTYAPAELLPALPAAPGHTARAPAPATAGDDGDEPPVRLDEYGMRVWRGEIYPTTDSGDVDRSAALWQINCLLDEAGATTNTKARALQERDETLDWNKFTDRPEQYRIMAQKIASRERAPATTSPCDDQLAALRAELDQVRAEAASLRATNRALLDVLRSEATPVAKVAQVAVAVETHAARHENLLSPPTISKRYHISEDSLSRALAARSGEDGVYERCYTYRRCCPYTGEIWPEPRRYLTVVPLRADLTETLAACAADVPDELRPTPRRPRTAPQPEATDAPGVDVPPCPDDGDTGVTAVAELVQVHRCDECGVPLAAQTADGAVLTLPRKPQGAGEGTVDPTNRSLRFTDAGHGHGRAPTPLHRVDPTAYRKEQRE